MNNIIKNCHTVYNKELIVRNKYRNIYIIDFKLYKFEYRILQIRVLNENISRN